MLYPFDFITRFIWQPPLLCRDLLEHFFTAWGLYPHSPRTYAGAAKPIAKPD